MKSSFFKVAAVGAGALASGLSVLAAGTAIVTAVYSEVSNGYARQKLPDGSLKREYYAIANGGYSPGSSAEMIITGVAGTPLISQSQSMI